MAKKLQQISGGIILFIISFFIFPACTEEQTSGQEENYVVIISIDGFPHEALWDRRVPLPSIRALAAEGTWSVDMIPSTPSVTWPNHTTLTTGVHPEKHGVLTNGVFVRGEAGEPVYRENDVDRGELSTYPTLFDVAHEEGLTTAEINWPVTRNAQTLHYSFPDAVDPVTHASPLLRTELVDAGILEEATEQAFELGAAGRDDVRTRAAAHLIRTYQPNLLLFHLLNVDGAHHRYGVFSEPGLTALALADVHVGEILKALDEAGIRDQTTVFVVSDHGFMDVTKRLRPNVLLRQNGLLETDEQGNITRARVQILSNGGTAMVFATDPATKEEDLETARSLFKETEGITHILGPDEYKIYGLPDPAGNNSMGDLLLAADNGYIFDNEAAGEDAVVLQEGTYATHGYLSNLDEMKTVFVAAGRGIRTGLELGEVDNRSVAPTAAYLLGLTLDTADGKIMKEILELE